MYKPLENGIVNQRVICYERNCSDTDTLLHSVRGKNGDNIVYLHWSLDLGKVLGITYLKSSMLLDVPKCQRSAL